MDADHSDDQATNRQQKKEGRLHQPVRALVEWCKQIWASFKMEARSIKFWVELFALIGLGIYTAFAALQWRANKEAADAAKSAADTAARQLTDFENVQRAKLVLQFADEHEVYERNGDLYIRGVINIQNVGQTPALQFVFRHGDFGVRNAPEKCPSTYEVIQPDPYGPAFPGNEKRSYHYTAWLGNVDQVRNKQWYAGITLHFAYKDIFDKTTSVSTWYTYVANREIFMPCVPEEPRSSNQTKK